MFRGIFCLIKNEYEMKDKIKAVKVNLRILLERIEAIKIPRQINYEIDQKVNELSDKIYEMADLLEEIEALEEL